MLGIESNSIVSSLCLISFPETISKRISNLDIL